MANTALEAHSACGNPTPALEDESALKSMAEAWVDRWRALGGSFGWTYSADLSVRTLHHGIPMCYVWEPPTVEEALATSPHLQPHELILRREDFEGAQKMLESFLTLVPGLRDAVRELGEQLVEAGQGHPDPGQTRRFLERRRSADTVAEVSK